MGRGEGALQRTERRILVFAGWGRGRHRPHTLLLTNKNSGQAGGWGGGRQPPSSRLCLSRSARLATQAICRKPAMAMAVIARFPPSSTRRGVGGCVAAGERSRASEVARTEQSSPIGARDQININRPGECIPTGPCPPLWRLPWPCPWPWPWP